MRKMVHDLAADPTTRVQERLIAFGELLQGHIHTEERILFEQMQDACTPRVLEVLGTRIAEHGGEAGSPSCRLTVS